MFSSIAVFRMTDKMIRILNALLLLCFLVMLDIDALPTNSKPCPKVNEIQTAKDFNLSKFMKSVWYTKTYNSFVEIPGFHINQAKHSDLQSRLLNTSDGIIIKNAGYHEFHGKKSHSYCSNRSGTVNIKHANEPAKLELAYKIPIPSGVVLNHKFTYWIYETDYNYAVVYCCSKENSDNTCAEDHSHLWTITSDKNMDLTTVINERLLQIGQDLCVKGPHKTIEFPGRCNLAV